MRERLLGGSGDEHESDRLSALLDDELDVDAAIVVSRHVASCNTCMAEFEELRRVRDALRSLPAVDPPAELYAGVKQEAVAPPGPSTGLRVLLALTASALVASGALVLADRSESGTIAPPVDVFVAEHLARTQNGPVFRPVNLGR